MTEPEALDKPAYEMKKDGETGEPIVASAPEDIDGAARAPDPEPSMDWTMIAILGLIALILYIVFLRR